MAESTDPPTIAKIVALKARSPHGTFLMFRDGDTCVCYGEDAFFLWELLDREPVLSGGPVPSLSFPAKDMEIMLANVLAAGMRAAVVDRVPGEAALGQQVERIVTPGRMEDA